MKRYYICEVSFVDIGGGDMGYVPAVRDHGVALSCVMAPENPTWSLVIVKADDHSMLLADPRILALPALPLDAMVATIPGEQISAVVDRLAQFDAVVPELPSLLLYRDVIREIGRRLENDFDEHTLDVP
ncbi:hypothetical protein [Massilia timonae]|uniref:hypothetical protein n=1 Tax=Massilia timonae TaxID=47229 RepID=UPI0028D594EB|nr:hypothetical protein [Massilia timonae]